MSFNVFSSSPRDYQDYLEQGLLRMQRGDLDGALTSFKRSIRLERNPEFNPSVYINLGLVLIDLQRFEKAIKFLDVIIKTGVLPHAYTAYLYKGEALMKMLRWKEAEVILTSGISYVGHPPEMHPYSEMLPELLATMHHNRAIARMSQSRFSEAVQDYNRAIQWNGRDIDYYASRCVALLQSGDRAGAQKDFDFVKRNAPHHPMIAQLRGVFGSENALDILNEARAKNIDLRTPLIKYPDSPEKHEAVKQLLEERQYDAAALLLETMSFSDTEKWVHRVRQFILARTLQGHILGLLEEWIIENQQLFGFRHDLTRHAMTYLYNNSFSPQLTQTILDRLKVDDNFGNSLNNNDFSRVQLGGVDLASTHVVNSDFSMASLHGVNFQNSNLTGSKFIGADLRMANLSGSDCQYTNFSRADLSNVDFTGTNLDEAGMFGAFICGAKFDTSTKLPDGTFWSADTDLEKFTGLKFFTKD